MKRFLSTTTAKMSTTRKFNLGCPADLHVHLRDGKMMDLVTPTVREGGVSVAYVMPNLVPPVTTIERVMDYKERLEKLAPKTTFLMTFYLCKELTPELVEKAAELGVIHGIKCYPAGVTTNSSKGVDPNDFSAFYPIFEVMQKNSLVLNLHGEKPSTHNNHKQEHDEEPIHILNAEPKFLPALIKLHQDFPKLKIVLEHCTTKAAIDAVRQINSTRTSGEPVTVAATITAHHLFITIDDVCGNPINFCKPVAKLPIDRRALIDAATSGEDYYFFGSDSAPHILNNKSRNMGVCAGVYVQNNAIAYVAEVFDKYNKLDNLKKFVTDNGKKFYNLADDKLKCLDEVELVERKHEVPEFIGELGTDLIVQPFKPKEVLSWDVQWTNKFN